MLEEMWHASLAIGLLTVLILVLCLTLTDLPLGSILFGEAIGAPTGIAMLTLTSPRRRRR
jgi:hypothetical protein